MTSFMFSNKKTYLFSVLLFLILCPTISVYAQDNSDEVLITIGNNKVSKTEFLNVYQKNNAKGDAMDRKSLEEYLDLYINFRLKVKEAEELGLDTMKSFNDELNGYRKQLAQPYLIDEDVNKALAVGWCTGACQDANGKYHFQGAGIKLQSHPVYSRPDAKRYCGNRDSGRNP